MIKIACRLLKASLLLLIISSALYADWVTDSIIAGTNPYALAVNPVTNKTYVANNGSGTVTVINNATGSTTTTTVGTMPAALGINTVTNRIYVANSGSNSVTVIDGASNATTLIPVGTSPCAIGVNTVRNLVYSVNSGSNSLSIINGVSNAVSTVAVGGNPCAIAIDPVRNRAYVVNKGSNTLSILDSTNSVIKTIAVGNSPCAVAVNVATDTIYVANQTSGTVTIINGVTFVTQTITVGSYPCAVAVNPATNTACIANYLSNTVTVLNGKNLTTTTLTVGTSPNALAINVCTNKIYVTNTSSNSVSIINGDSNTVTSVNSGMSPHAVAINPIINKIYTANLGSNSVSVIDGADFVQTALTGGVHNNTRAKVAINPFSNKIYFTMPEPGHLSILNGYTQSFNAKIVSALSSIAINYTTNKVYAGDATNNQVLVIDGTTDSITASIPISGSPLDIAVNPNTNMIYVVSSNTPDNITIINGATNTTASIRDGHDHTLLAINPVTNKVYAAMSNGDGITVIDGFTNQFDKNILLANGGIISSMAINPLTNTIYVANSVTNKVAGINETTGAITQIAVNSSLISLMVNPANNTIYAANYISNYFPAYSISVINGYSNSVTNVRVGENPTNIILNPLTNTVYCLCNGDSSMWIIDPISLRTKSIKVINDVQVFGINPATSTLYIMSKYFLNILQSNTFTNTKVTAYLDTTGKSIVATSRPVLNGTATNSSLSKPQSIIEKIMEGNGFIPASWSAGTIIGNASTSSVSWNWNWGTDSLLPGLNYLSCAAFESNSGTTNNYGTGTPFSGNVTVYPILYYRPIQIMSVPAAPSLASPENGAIEQPLSPILTWSSVGNVATYRIQVATVSTFITTVVNDSAMVGTSKSLASLQSGILYYWRVNATNVNGTSSWSAVWHFTIGTSAPGAPTLITPANKATNVPINPQLVWNMATGAVFYTVQVAFDSAFTQLTVNDSTVTITAKSVPSLPIFSKCFWRVKAKSTTGIGSWSSIWSFTIGSTSPIISNTGKSKTLAFGCAKQGNSICYSLPQECRVTLCYYDIRGRLAATMINKIIPAGEYSLPVDNSFPARGAYVQVFKAGSYVKQECVTLVR